MSINDLLLLDKYLNKKIVTEHNIDYDANKTQIIQHNHNFVNKKLLEYNDYFDNMFAKIDSKIKLDKEQRIAILTDEDYNLIIAGAGSGKTTTMLAKIKYLIEKCGVDSKEISALSFARKNVNEFDQKINKKFNMNVDVMTFHKLGKEIIEQKTGRSVEIVTEGDKYKIFEQYFKEELFKNKKALRRMVDFLVCYFSGDKKMEQFASLEEYNEYRYKQEFQSLQGKLADYNEKIKNKRQKYYRTINSEYVRSYEEVAIANSLFINGLDYKYEEKYSKSKRVYHPDFKITQGENIVYLEHFGIHENGTNHIYEEQELKKYLHQIKLKEQTHHRNGTTLIKTFSSYNDGKHFLVHLQELLERNNFILKKKTDEEIFNRLKETSGDRYFFQYIKLALEFLSKLKINKYNEEKLKVFFEKEEDPRTKKFIATFYPIYIYYQGLLKHEGRIDFEDMIIEAEEYLKKSQPEDFSFNYKYLIVDEFQDISQERYSLIKLLANMFNSQIIAVGDDWQAIFGFAGSNVELFTKFIDDAGYGECLKIQHTYRNSQELIDVASEFAERDESHIKKKLQSNKKINRPIVVFSYENEGFGKNESKALAITKAIGEILAENANASILILGRYGFDIHHLLNTDLFQKRNETEIYSVEYPKAKLFTSTVHKAKGLEYDQVIIANAIDTKYGFPSKLKQDPIFNLFGNENISNIEYAEERRLFYVALTRTKNRVYIMAPQDKPSPFVLELENNLNVDFRDDVVERYREDLNAMKCPKCGSYLKKGCIGGINVPVYRCIQEKEVCDFFTNDLETKIAIKNCEKCNGYLIYKKRIENGNFMLGCTNYQKENINCDNIEFINNDNIKKETIDEIEIIDLEE